MAMKKQAPSFMNRLLKDNNARANVK